MKKFSLAVLACVAACGAFAQTFSKTDDDIVHYNWPLSLSLAYPLQLPDSTYNINGLALDVIYGEHHNMNGLDVGLVSFNTGNVKALQIKGLASWTDFSVYGCQISGLANVVLGNAYGLQLSSLANYNRGEFVGAQIAAANCNGAFYGFQTGVFNYNKGACRAIQFGLVNADVNDYRGWSFGGVNYAVRYRGVQIGAINTIAETGRAIQIGAINSAANFAGVQLGLFNIIENGALPIMVVVNASF